jgi:hypothetical protein
MMQVTRTKCLKILKLMLFNFQNKTMQLCKMFCLFILLEVGLANGYTTAATTKTPNVDKPGMFYLHFLGRFVCNNFWRNS